MSDGTIKKRSLSKAGKGAKKPNRPKRRKARKMVMQAQKWLVLAGTKEARDFISHWRHQEMITIIASLAGVTTAARELGVETRIGGFSDHDCDGAEGMARFLIDGHFDAVIDLTHPFAAQISANARQAVAKANEITGKQFAYYQFLRRPWQALPDDHWRYHDSWEALFATVRTPHLFIAGGHEALAALSASDTQRYSARMIEPPQKPADQLPENLSVLLGYGTDEREREIALFRKLRITAVAAKLSGGKQSAGKLAAARALGLQVHLVKRPDYPEGWFDDLDKFNAFLRRRSSVPAG